MTFSRAMKMNKMTSEIAQVTTVQWDLRWAQMLQRHRRRTQVILVGGGVGDGIHLKGHLKEASNNEYPPAN